MRKKVLLAGVGLLQMHLSLMSQDLHFSQFFELPLLRNPALAGIYKGDIRFTTVYRNQWEAVPVKYRTQGIGLESKFGISSNSDDFLSLGLQFTNDVAGDGNLGKFQVLPVVAFHKLLSQERNLYLTAGFIGGPVSQRVDPTRLRFDDQFVNGAYSATNPTRQDFSNTNITYFDMGAGLSISSDFGGGNRFYLGGSYLHFNNPKVAFSALNDIRLNRKFAINAGLSLFTSDADLLTFYGDGFFQGGSNTMLAGVTYKHILTEYQDDETVAFTMGCFYRWNDAVVPVIKLDYLRWGFGVSYDVNISKLKTASQFRGGLEVTLSYKSFLNILNSSAQKVRCPVDFW